MWCTVKQTADPRDDFRDPFINPEKTVQKPSKMLSTVHHSLRSLLCTEFLAACYR